MTPEEPKDLRAMIEAAGISQQEAARMLHVDPRTMRRWIAGTSEVPWCAIELLRRLIKEM